MPVGQVEPLSNGVPVLKLLALSKAHGKPLMMLQLNPTVPLDTPKGKGHAHLVIDYSQEHNLLWVVFLDESRECWTFPNSQVRIQQNQSLRGNEGDVVMGEGVGASVDLGGSQAVVGDGSGVSDLQKLGKQHYVNKDGWTMFVQEFSWNDVHYLAGWMYETHDKLPPMSGTVFRLDLEGLKGLFRYTNNGGYFRSEGEYELKL